MFKSLRIVFKSNNICKNNMILQINIDFFKTSLFFPITLIHLNKSPLELQSSIIFTLFFVWGMLCFYHFFARDLVLINTSILSYLLIRCWSERKLNYHRFLLHWNSCIVDTYGTNPMCPRYRGLTKHLLKSQWNSILHSVVLP